MKYKIEDIINEIEFNLLNEKYFSALSIALILPDLCSKIENISYQTWIDKYLNECFCRINPLIYDEKASWGQIIYKLRCGLLHEGKEDVCNKDCYAIHNGNKNAGIKIFDLDCFELFVNKKDKHTIMKLNRESGLGAFKKTDKIQISIDIDFLINGILDATKRFCEINREGQTYSGLEITMY